MSSIANQATKSIVYPKDFTFSKSITVAENTVAQRMWDFYTASQDCIMRIYGASATSTTSKLYINGTEVASLAVSNAGGIVITSIPNENASLELNKRRFYNISPYNTNVNGSIELQLYKGDKISFYTSQSTGTTANVTIKYILFD